MVVYGGTYICQTSTLFGHSPWSRYMCEGDVVVSDISQAGKNLCEGGNDEVLAVSETGWLMIGNIG